MRNPWLLFLVWLVPQIGHAESFLMGIAEGVASQTGMAEMQEKYQPLADYLSRALRGKITVESSQSIQSANLNLKKGRYDLMFCRPSNVAGRAIRDYRYQLVAMAKGEFAAYFIARADFPFKRKEDILSHSIAMPEEGALMSRVAMAEMRDMGNPDPKTLHIRHTKYQEAVSFMVENQFADVGVVAPVIAKQWPKRGGVVLFKSRPLPFWSIIASSRVTKDEVASLQKALLALENSEEGKKILSRIDVKAGWVPGNAQDYIDMMTWLGV